MKISSNQIVLESISFDYCTEGRHVEHCMVLSPSLQSCIGLYRTRAICIGRFDLRQTCMLQCLCTARCQFNPLLKLKELKLFKPNRSERNGTIMRRLQSGILTTTSSHHRVIDLTALRRAAARQALRRVLQNRSLDHKAPRQLRTATRASRCHHLTLYSATDELHSASGLGPQLAAGRSK